MWSGAGLDRVEARPHSDIGCAFCHVPHNATGNNTEVPLWNPEFTSTTLEGGYSNPDDSLDADDIGEPNGASKLCLSCHDGTMFMSTEHTFGDGEYEEMGTLETSHPISFVYDQELADADGELVDPGDLEPDVLDGNSRMQCSSCHDVHQQAVDQDKLLRWVEYDTETAGSTSSFCRHCHLK